MSDLPQILSQISFKLDLKELVTSNQEGVTVYLYTNDHVQIPKFSAGLFGSAMRNTFVIPSSTGFFKKFYTRRNKAIRMDRIGKRCSNDKYQEPVGRCIVRYLEDTHNCTSFHLMANKTMPICDRYTNGLIVDILNNNWRTWTENDIIDQGPDSIESFGWEFWHDKQPDFDVTTYQMYQILRFFFMQGISSQNSSYF